MKRSFHLPHLSTIVHERLAALDATKLPAAALGQIERDVLSACQRVVMRTITGPRIGRAVAAALAAPAATQGCKGGTPLPSNSRERSEPNCVAGQAGECKGQTTDGNAAGVSVPSNGGTA